VSAAGTVTAVVATLVDSLLYGVSARPSIMVGAAATFLAIAAAAAFMPARRAARIDPLRALRFD
jgi:ABC-type antimicrobial peptide transport system permease subunit